MDLKTVIIAGDLNLTLNSSEIWGSRARSDPLHFWFQDFFCDHKLFDVLPMPLRPTWSNGRRRDALVTKRLDRFLVSCSIIETGDRCTSSIPQASLSDHNPILLRLQEGPTLYKFPFKYCHVWSEEKVFNSLVHEHWNTFYSNPCTGKAMVDLPPFLKSLKSIIIPWLHMRKKEHSAELDQIEEHISDYHSDPLYCFQFDPEHKLLLSLIAEKDRLMRIEEEHWRLKSRALWITMGDQNTRFFHKFASMRRRTNSIWDIEDSAGNSVSSQELIEKAVMGHFQKLFSKPRGINLQAQMEVIQCMPRIFTAEDNVVIGRPVTLGEVEGILKKMAKDKSPGPDGWSVEFYLHFFDLLGDEMVCLVEEAHISGRISGGLNATFIALIPKISELTNIQDFRPISLCNLLQAGFEGYCRSYQGWFVSGNII